MTFYLIVWGFTRTFATGAECQQRTLTPPGTWSCPTLGVACVLMSRPISPELVCSGLLSFENPSLLLFCFESIQIFCVKIDWNYNLWVDYTIPFDFRLFRHFRHHFLKFFEILCLDKDHWWGFSTRNAHMVHFVNWIRLKIVYTS